MLRVEKLWHFKFSSSSLESHGILVLNDGITLRPQHDMIDFTLFRPFHWGSFLTLNNGSNEIEIVCHSNSIQGAFVIIRIFRVRRMNLVFQTGRN